MRWRWAIVLVLASICRGQTLATPRGELAIFPEDNAWNRDVSALPVHPLSQEYIRSIGVERGLKADFGTVWKGRPVGIPFNLVAGEHAKVAVEFQYAQESDPGPYPIPEQPLIEGGPDAPLDTDRHVLIIDYDNQRLYELFGAVFEAGRWRAGSGAVWDLTSNKLRPERWTSADAAGLPIFPGLARYDEVVERGEVRHALRFTARRTQRGYIHPATHWASASSDRRLPPMGLRVRLRADFDTSAAPREVRVILEGLKRYGMILADNGGDWFISGAPDPRWDDQVLHWLSRVKGGDMEAVDTGPLVHD